MHSRRHGCRIVRFLGRKLGGVSYKSADGREDVPFPVMVIGVKVEEALAFKTGVPTA